MLTFSSRDLIRSPHQCHLLLTFFCSVSQMIFQTRVRPLRTPLQLENNIDVSARSGIFMLSHNDARRRMCRNTPESRVSYKIEPGIFFVFCGATDCRDSFRNPVFRRNSNRGFFIFPGATYCRGSFGCPSIWIVKAFPFVRAHSVIGSVQSHTQPFLPPIVYIHVVGTADNSSNQRFSRQISFSTVHSACTRPRRQTPGRIFHHKLACCIINSLLPLLMWPLLHWLPTLWGAAFLMDKCFSGRAVGRPTVLRPCIFIVPERKVIPAKGKNRPIPAPADAGGVWMGWKSPLAFNPPLARSS